MSTGGQTELWLGNEALRGDRERLVRLCARISGRPESAEDLAHEALLEAWRHREKLTEPAGRWPWLAAIARNVCLRGGRARGREAARVASPPADGGAHSAIENLPDREGGVELDLERDELARLLDRALALLPEETRSILTARLVEERPQAEVAARGGLSEGAVAVRLHRGKLALRRVLATDLREEARSFGLYDEMDALRETPLWCPICGHRKLRGRFDRAAGELLLRCPTCTPRPGDNISNATMPELFGGVRGYGPAMLRLMEWADGYYRPAAATGRAVCPDCASTARVRVGELRGAPRSVEGYGVEIVCPSCGVISGTAFVAVALCIPEGRRFWEREGRVRMLPVAGVESHGTPCLVAVCESVASGARMEVVATREAYEVLSVRER